MLGRPRTLANAIKFAFWVERDVFDNARKRAFERERTCPRFCAPLSFVSQVAGANRGPAERKSAA